MELKISAPGGNEYQLIQTATRYEGFFLPDHSAIEMVAPFGEALFRHYRGNGFDIWCSIYDIKHQTKLSGRLDVETFELHMQFAKGFETKWDGIGSGLIKPYQYNLSYLPFLSNEALFKKNTCYHTFDIHFTIGFLERLSPHFPALDRLLSKATRKKPGSISKTDRFLTPEMITIVHQIMKCPFKNGSAALYIESKVLELLLNVLDHLSEQDPAAPIKLSVYDKARLHDARELVIKDFENPLSIIQLSRKVGINDFKLKKGFKHLFGTTVFDFMHGQRMEKARQLLLETNLSVEEIAYMLGYEYESNFNKAFKKHFNYTAAYLRKSKKLE
ncbi:MAG: helix-turn-helix transcriptional regulator [Flavisolibacter sp.]|nr:helix-turn-helix transcriptional regulator [Flavisolibacter sp.]